MIGFEDVQSAAQRIQNDLLPTPLLRAFELERRMGFKVSLKLENLQPTGAFKVRGAFNTLLGFSSDQRHQGVVAASGGNHARAIAFAAQRLGIPATVCMSRHAPIASQRYCQALGSRLEFTETHPEAFERAMQISQTENLVFVHPYATPSVMAGQGTIALEVLQQAPDLTDLLVSVGGGGMLSGILTAVQHLKPELRVWAVETQGTNTLERSIKAGRPMPLERIQSIAWSLGAPSVTPFALELAQAHLAGLEVVSDVHTKQAIRVLLEDCKLLVEPAAACTLAALEQIQTRLPASAHVALVLCSGNYSLEETNSCLENV